MKSIYRAVFPLFALVTSAVAAEDLLVFDIGNLAVDPPGSLAPAHTAPNVTGTNLVRTGVNHDAFFGQPDNENDGLYGASNWPSGGSPDSFSYFEFSVSPSENFSLGIDSLAFALFTEHTRDDGDVFLGPETWDVRYSFDNFASSVLLDTIDTPHAENVSAEEAAYAQHQFEYQGLALNVPDGQILRFRFFGYGLPEGSDPVAYGGFSNAPDGSGAPGTGVGLSSTWVGEGSDIILTGTVIPEPSHSVAALAALALAATAAFRRRRRVPVAGRPRADSVGCDRAKHS